MRACLSCPEPRAVAESLVVKPLVLWGATGQAKVLREFVGARGFEIVALFDNDPSLQSPFAGVPLFRGRAGFARWREDNRSLEAWGLVAIGGGRGRDRVEVQQFLVQNGVRVATVVHPAAYVAGDARVGAGGQVLARAVVGALARLGEGCIVNTAASLDHECVLGDGVHIAPGAVLAGEVRVGDFAFVGANAVVLPRLTIGVSAVVGAGAVVTKDVPDGAVVYGNPARARA